MIISQLDQPRTNLLHFSLSLFVAQIVSLFAKTGFLARHLVWPYAYLEKLD